MGDSMVSALCWLAAMAIALGALVLGHDPIAALALVVAAVATAAGRRSVRAEHTALVDGMEAVGVAAVGVAVAATSKSPVLIGAGAAIAFAAVVQQYAALVFAHLVRGRAALAGPPIGAIAMLGLAIVLAAGRPVLALVALACWCAIDCTWSAIVRGIAVAQHDRARVRPPILPPLAGRARWRRLGHGIATARDTAFWGLVVARPLARVVLQLVAEQRWITPNRITVASIAVCLAAAVAIVEDAAVAAIAMIGIRSVLDSLDGQLARYRACGTSLGSYVDKVSDLFCWGALFAALGIRAHAAEQAPAYLLLPLIAALALALLGFSLWLSRALLPAAAAPSAPPSRIGFAAWAGSLWRIVLFEEPDFYLWIALAVATARYDLFVPCIAGAYVLRVMVLAIARAGIARTAARTIGVKTAERASASELAKAKESLA